MSACAIKLRVRVIGKAAGKALINFELIVSAHRASVIGIVVAESDGEEYAPVNNRLNYRTDSLIDTLGSFNFAAR